MTTNMFSSSSLLFVSFFMTCIVLSNFLICSTIGFKCMECLEIDLMISLATAHFDFSLCLSFSIRVIFFFLLRLKQQAPTKCTILEMSNMGFSYTGDNKSLFYWILGSDFNAVCFKFRFITFV